MIAVDSNILVYAHREDSAFHRPALQRLTALAEGPEAWVIPWPCLHEFLAIVTHPRIYVPPTPLDGALDQIDAWLQSPTVALLGESTNHWPTLRSLLVNSQVIGPRIHDARVAALCKQHGIRQLWSADRDFGRFAGISVINPLFQV